MRRRVLLASLPLAWALLVATAAAPAAEDLLKLVPNNAFGLIVLNRPAALDAKLQTLGSQMQLPLPGLLAMLKPLLGIQEGTDDNGILGLLVLPPSGDSPLPTTLLFVPVTNYAKFVGQLQADDARAPVTKIKILKTELWARNVGGYAALAGLKYRAVLENTVTLAPEIPAGLAAWRTWLANKDLAGVVLPSGIKELSAKAQLGIGITKLALAAQANEQAKAAASMFDMYSRMCQTAEKGVTGFGFEVQLDSRNVLRIGSRTLLKPGTALARLASEKRPAQENLLAGLPAGPFVVAGGGAISGMALEEMRKWSMELMRSAPNLYGLNAEQSAKLAAISMQSMEGMHSMSVKFSAEPQDQTIFSNLIGIMRIEGAPAFMTFYEQGMRKYSQLIAELHSSILQPAEIQQCDIAGVTALQLTTKVPLPQAGMQTPQQLQMQSLMFGPDAKVVAWLAPADEHHVMLGYVNKKPLEQAIEAFRKGQPDLAADAGVAKTAALLPAGALAVGYLSPAGTLQFMQRMAAAVIPPQANVNVKFPPFPSTPPLGFAVTTAANELRTCLAVPAEVLQAIGPYVGQLQAQRSAAVRTKP